MLLRDFILWLSTKKRLTHFLARRGMRAGFAQRFVAGERLADAIGASLVLQKLGYGIILNHLGENVTTREEAARTRDSYVEMIHASSPPACAATSPSNPRNLVSISAATFANRFRSRSRKRPSASAAELKWTWKARRTRTSRWIFSRPCSGRSGTWAWRFNRICGAPKRNRRLAPLSPKIRLVKGAYREAPSIAFQKKREVDENYRRLTDRLLALAGEHRFFAAIATHDPAMVDYRAPKSHRTI